MVNIEDSVVTEMLNSNESIVSLPYFLSNTKIAFSRHVHLHPYRFLLIYYKCTTINLQE